MLIGLESCYILRCYILRQKVVTFWVKKLLHFALKRCYILRQKLLHFGLMLHFASVVTFCGVTRRGYFSPSRPMQTDATSANNSQHCWMLLANNVAWPKSLTGFKLYATNAKKCQHCCGSMQTDQQVTTLLGPTMLGVVGQQCWIRLHGPLCYKGLKDKKTCSPKMKRTISFAPGPVTNDTFCI